MYLEKYRLSLSIKGELHIWNQPLIMGILNVTPDSFYAESRIESTQELIDRAGQMLTDGADILDIGGQSTRPGATLLTCEQEVERVIPAVQLLSKEFPKAILSIDTFYAEVANQSIASGGHIINDISAGDFDAEMLKTVSKNKVPYIAMHKNGSIDNLHQKPDYKNVTTEVCQYLNQKLEACKQNNIQDVIVDPGFGFGKTQDQNFELLRNISSIKHLLQSPILVGISRKSMIWKKLGITPEASLPATSALHFYALQQGADMLRVHDVKEAVQVRELDLTPGPSPRGEGRRIDSTI